MNIPEGQLATLGKIFLYDQDRLDLLLVVFRDAKPSLFINDFVSTITESLKTTSNEAEEIARTLVSVYASRVALAQKISIEEFLNNICDALSVNHPPDENWNRFRKFITDFLNLKGSMELTSKSLSVLMANERNCIGSRIVTDFRPVFKENPADEPAGAVIVHSLKLDYREGDQPKEFFIALDSRDVHLLKQAVERALIKEATLIALAGKMNLSVVRPEV